MNYRFVAEPNPDEGRCQQLADCQPHDPFSTWGFLAFRAAGGESPWLLKLSGGDDRVAAGCFGFIAQGRLTRTLDIHSLPELPTPEVFWEGLRQFCTKQAITSIQINTFGSTRSAIPELGRRGRRRSRREFSLDLTSPVLFQGMSSNHKRNVKRAEKAELSFSRGDGWEAAECHANAISGSMVRRKERGEDVSANTRPEAFKRLVDHGAGEFFQVLDGDLVLSSLLVLRAAKGAYYHSAGSLPQGMASGASHFLIVSLAERLREEGAELFNLGGASAAEEGLARFKAGFGAKPVDLEAAEFHLASPLRRALVAGVRQLQRFG